MALSNSYQILDKIITILFEPEARRIDKLVSRLNELNHRAKGKPCYGFMHMGEVYVPSEHIDSFRAVHGRRGASQAVPTLAITLMDEARDFLAEVNKVKSDKDLIRQVLFKLIFQAGSKQEIRDALPECIVQLLPELKNYNRQQNDPAYLIRSDWRAVRDYEKALPKIELYAMTRLLY